MQAFLLPFPLYRVWKDHYLPLHSRFSFPWRAKCQTSPSLVSFLLLLCILWKILDIHLSSGYILSQQLRWWPFWYTYLVLNSSSLPFIIDASAFIFIIAIYSYILVLELHSCYLIFLVSLHSFSMSWSWITLNYLALVLWVFWSLISILPVFVQFVFYFSFFYPPLVFFLNKPKKRSYGNLFAWLYFTENNLYKSSPFCYNYNFLIF